MNQPLAATMAVTILGILLADHIRGSLAWLLPLSILCAYLALRASIGRWALLTVLVLLAAWTNARVHSAIYAPNDLRVLMGDRAALVTLRGVLVESPIEGPSKPDATDIRVRVRVDHIRLDDAWGPASGLVLARHPATLGPRYHRGSVVEMTGARRARSV